MFVSKFKFLILFISLGGSLFASHASFFSLYIPVANPQSSLMDRDGIELQKVLVYSYLMDADISAVTWEHRINAPDTRLNQMNVNLANIKGLTVEAKDYGSKECVVTIDSSHIFASNNEKRLDKILKYVKKAVKLTLKDNGHHCKIKEIKAPYKKIPIPSIIYPKPLNLESRAFSVFSSYNSGFAQNSFLHDTFYPLGYNNGKLAYAIEYDTDPADMVRIETFVQDLVTDKIVWHHKFQTEENIKNVNFKSFWRENHKMIKERLSQHGVYYSNWGSLLTEELHYRKDYLKLSSKVEKRYNPDWGAKFVTNSILYLSSQIKGRKVIDKKSYYNSQILEREILGFLNVEKGNRRIAVVVANLNRGWEGPPHVISYEIVGANLEVGFGK